MRSVPLVTAALPPSPAPATAGEPATFLSAKDFDGLYSAYFHHVTRWARSFGCPAADIDDVAQETFLVARNRLAQFDGENAAGWLYRIAQHVTRAQRRTAWVRRVLHLDPDLRAADPQQVSPAEALEQRESRRKMQDILSRMTERRRTAFFLFEIEGYTGEEIAQLERISLNTVYSRLHHARREFMTLLAKAEGMEPGT